MIQLERAALISPAKEKPLGITRIQRFVSAVVLVRFATLLLACALPGQRLLGTAAIAWLQVERMLLDILDDIFLLHLPLEASKRALDRFAFLNFHFSQY